ncbi:MAG: TetR/AcrR family transcriptional regulator, partial [Conexibacter sp.]|nr:TetR/AcrR family transcriptional regulator [Conexibacter sp.]
MLVALGELGFRVQLEEPGQWQPDALAAYLARVVIRGIPKSR